MAVTQRLLLRLSTMLGTQSATQELRWMREAVTKASADAGWAGPALALEKMVARRERGEPLQYILGTQPFGPLELCVRAPVLIPRPDTESWAMRLHAQLSSARSDARPRRLLDLCTGTGCIPLLLCHLARPGSLHALGVDISQDAIALARENAQLVGMFESSNTRSHHNSFSALRADILSPDFALSLSALRWGSFDIITANPPYIPLSEYNELDRSVKDYEDPKALLGDPRPTDGKGLTFYRAIARLVGDGSAKFLKADGIIALEVGHNQAGAVRELMEATAGVRRTEIWEDPWGIERTVVCWK